MLKILMLNYEFPPIGGGAGKAHHAILHEFAKRQDMKIDVLTSAPLEQGGVEKIGGAITIEKIGIKKRNLHYWRHSEILAWIYKACRRYKQMLACGNYDLIHIFFGVPTGLVCWLCGTKSIPYVISLRGSDVPGKSNQFQLEHLILSVPLKSIWKKASALVACSEGLKARALEFYPALNIDVIGNGVDNVRFRPAENKTVSDLWRLLTVGRLTNTKRIDILIDAAEILKKQGLNISLTIAGTGKLQSQLQDIIGSRQLQSYINLTGRIESDVMPQLYRNHDIFISATVAEGMSNAMLEAMASGLPIITTECEGLTELLEDNGVILRQACAGTFAEAIKDILSNSEKYRTMALAARKRAERFAWPAVAQQYLDLYNRLIKV